MNICRNCGVELDYNMFSCPLCEQPANTDLNHCRLPQTKEQLMHEEKMMRIKQRKFLWEVCSVILGLTMVAILTLNIVINRGITWSEYPLSICIILFTYSLAFIHLNTKKIYKLFSAFLIASIALLILDNTTEGISWTIGLAIPILFCTNIIALLLIMIIEKTNFSGIKLTAYSLLAIALLCVCVEILIDNYINNQIRLIWSTIVSACIIPLSLLMLFIHSNLRKGGKFNKAFHI